VAGTRPLRRRLRLNDSRDLLDRLAGELQAWHGRRVARDHAGQFRTPLGALRTQLEGAIDEIRRTLDEAEAATATGDVYQMCRDGDLRTAFTRRIWEFYRDRFDQREQASLDRVLAAADEVVWSCWIEAYTNAGLEPGPAPLPYVEPRFSPVATPRISALPGLDAELDAVLLDHLRTLPIPLVALPPIVVEQPWWLTLLAHEVAHHVQHDLEDRALIRSFAEIVGDAAGPDDPETSDRWRGWSIELFADLYALLAVGPWSVHAVAELEATTLRRMVADRETYPAPALRIAALRRAGDVVGSSVDVGDLDAWPVLADLEVPWRTRRVALESAAAVMPAVVSAALTRPVLGDHTLPALCGLGDGGEIRRAAESWRERFRSGLQPTPTYQRNSARHAVAGAMGAAYDVSCIEDDAARTAERERHVEWTVDVVRRCRVEGIREAVLDVGAPEQAETFADRLFATEPETLR
jgi:hypothetical protein